MLFNSWSYAIFLTVVFFLYWFVFRKSLSGQNILLLAASYLFYGLWDWRFLFLLVFSTSLDYFTGLRIFKSKTMSARKGWLLTSIIINLGFLIFFKYFNFFMGSFTDLLHGFGVKPNVFLLHIVLPVGISFYTFHGLSYVFDIYNNRVRPTTNVVEYSLFVSFFPLLVAGPIERATHLLPQVSRPRVFDYQSATDGLRQILWGLFKKMVIADSCARVVDAIFANPDSFSRGSLVAGAVLFSFQIYSDFSGYTDIAIGSGRLFGFELLRNFSYPYFSRDIAEFWRRWHISLTTWFRDYVYIPLGGSKEGTGRAVRNVFIVFLLSGIWHGANWTFVIWGLYHAVLFLPLLLFKKNRRYTGEIQAWIPSFEEGVRIFLTFVLVTAGWVFFRAPSVSQAWQYFADILRPRAEGSVFQMYPEIVVPMVFIPVLLVVEWVQKHNFHGLFLAPGRLPRPLRFAVYCLLLICIIWFGAVPQKFIYFQF